MCVHSAVTICPTSENSWGIEDTYDVKCIECDKIILAKASPDKIQNFLLNNNCHIVSGKQYLIPTSSECHSF